MNNSTKPWSDMATDLVNTWTETGSQMWKSWFDLVSSVPVPAAAPTAQPELQDATQKFLDNRELLVRFLKLSVDAWRDIFPKIATGDWEQVLRQYIEQMKQQSLLFSQAAFKPSENTAELWKMYLDQVQKFNQLWLDPMGFSNNLMTQAFSSNSSALIKMNNLYWDLLYEEGIGNLLQAPLLGLPREFNRKLLDGFEAWRNLYQASINYQALVADIQVRSFDALMQKLVSLTKEGKPVQNWREFQDLWSVIADDVFAEVFCDDKNLKIRGQFLNALNGYRLKQQELMELSMKMMNLPLRSEVDEIHKNIYELRKEVKRLNKALAKYESAEKNSGELATGSSEYNVTASPY